MNSKLVKVLVTGLLAIVLLGCADVKPKTINDFSDYYARGIESFKKKRWDKAIEDFNLVLLNSPGGELADDAQYYLGECYFEKKEYLLAISEYQQLTERYSYSPLVEDASYKMVLSYVELSPKYQRDQVYTDRALLALQEFLDSFPDSKYRSEIEAKIRDMRNKLARKMYESGVLYTKLLQWDAAIIYFDNMLEDYYDTKYAPLAKLDKALCLIRMRKFDEYKAFMAELEEHLDLKKYSDKLANLKRAMAREKKRIAREQKRNR